MERVRAAWVRIEEVFNGLGFTGVELDPNGYRRGGLLSLASHPSS